MSKINKLNPNWVTGFIDGEGCFTLSIAENVRCKTGWAVQACFTIVLHSRDEYLLLQIKSFFENTGKIWLKNDFVIYQVRSINDILKVIIPHFDKYPCITQKQSDFLIWKKIIELMNKGEHLNKDSLINIISLKASLNKGLSAKLKRYFPIVTEIKRSKINLPENIDPNWIAGFFSGEGCFFIALYKSKNYKYNYAIKLRLLISQHIKEEFLMNSLINILGCGYVSKNIKGNFVSFTITKFDDIL